MEKLVASRKAGLRLALVIGLLLLPSLYFVSLLTVITARDMAQARASAAGMQMMDDTLRVMVDLTDGWSVSDHQAQLLEDGINLAPVAGANEAFLKLYKQLTLPQGDRDRQKTLQAGANLLRAIGSGSAVNDPGNREANLLAMAASEIMPQMMLSMTKLSDATEDAMADQDRAMQQLPQLDAHVAELGYHARSLGTAITDARAISDDMGAYNNLLRNISKFGFDASYFRIVMYDPSGTRLDAMRKLSAGLGQHRHDWSMRALAMWEDFGARLRQMNEKRFVGLQSNTWWASAFAIIAVSIGLGTAFHLYRQTLNKLDEVEGSRAAADEARMAAEDSARELNLVNHNLARVNDEVHHHLSALKEAQDRLLKKGRMEQMGQLTATMAHELRNPLGAARTSLFTLERKTKGKGLGVEGPIERISTSIVRCDGIIAQLLDFSHAKELAPSLQDVDRWLTGVIAEEVKSMPANIAVTTNLGLVGRKVSFDQKQLRRAITNLLANACEAMAGGGEGRARAPTEDPHIEVRSSVVDGHVAITISDNGPGIAAGDIARVREPLFTTKSFGIGLGLPLAEQIAAQHGGSLEITSQLRAGTRVSITLPLAQRERMAA